MIKIGGTNVGESIRALRERRKMTRSELSEAAGISESHLKKIEAGARQPGINTYQRIIEILEVDIIIRNEEKTVIDICVAKVERILMNSTEASGLSLKMVQKLEAGQKGFRMETILRVAITLKVSLDSLSGMQEKERSRSFGQAMRYPLSSRGPWVVRHHACCCIRA